MDILIIAIILVAIFFYVRREHKKQQIIESLESQVEDLKNYKERTEAEKYQNWGDNLQVTGPFKMTLKEPAKQCVFSQWEISDDGPGRHQAFCLVYGKGNAEKVLKALNGS